VLIAVALVVQIVRRWWRKTPTTIVVGLTGGATQCLALLLRDKVLPMMGTQRLEPYDTASIFANTFGLFLAMLVWKDAQTRLKSEHNRLEAEHMRTLVIAADLAALRARIRPHFLFNTLAAIAALCDIDPRKAQLSVLKVSQLMRRHIEVDTTSLINVEKEMEYVRTYVEIQQVRFGSKARVQYDYSESMASLMIPAFSIQTMVENSFQHGLERRSGQGSIRIAIIGRRRDSVCAVIDDGAGMTADQAKACLPNEAMPRHGLAIVDQQLRSMFGQRGRLRIFSIPGVGTTVAFRVPSRHLEEDVSE
jgi:LytS/YehU family sensor histidine kinase